MRCRYRNPHPHLLVRSCARRVRGRSTVIGALRAPLLLLDEPSANFPVGGRHDGIDGKGGGMATPRVSDPTSSRIADGDGVDGSFRLSASSVFLVVAYRIEFTAEALEDLASLRDFDLRRVVNETEVQLKDEPTRKTRRRKRLRPNQLAEWELRVESFRVFYDVFLEDSVVKVVAVGSKVGNDLLIHGEKYEL